MSTVNAAITVRRAQEADRAAIEAMADHTWDGLDYTPNQIAEWLAELNGEFYIALDGGDVVGTGKLSQFGEDEWWLEPFRVHPHYQGKGIGRALHRYGVSRAESAGSGVLRLAIESVGKGAQLVAAENGFSMVGRYVLYQSGATDRAAHADEFRPLELALLPAVRAFLEKSSAYGHASRSFEDSWTWYFLTDDRLRARIAADQPASVYTWHGVRRSAEMPDGVIILNLAPKRRPIDPSTVNVAYLDAAAGSLAVMTHAARSLSAALGFERIEHRFLARPERLVAIEQAGWRRAFVGGGEDYLYSRPLGASVNSLNTLTDP